MSTREVFTISCRSLNGIWVQAPGRLSHQVVSVKSLFKQGHRRGCCSIQPDTEERADRHIQEAFAVLQGESSHCCDSSDRRHLCVDTYRRSAWIDSIFRIPKDLCWVWSVVHSGSGAIAFIVLGLLLSLHRVLLPNGTHLLRTWYRLHSTSLNPDLPALSHVTTISSQIPDPWPTSPTQGEPVPVPTL
jgi:hypothetical protein